jgi:hypothetical protein
MNKFQLAVKTLLVFILALATFTVFAGLSVGFSSAGRGSIIVTVTTRGDFDSFRVNVSGTNLSATCTNPAGNIAPGKKAISYADFVQYQSPTRENGTNTYTVEVPGPLVTTSSRDAGCPNDNWWVSRVTGTLNINVSVIEGTNGRVRTFSVTCPNYDSSSDVIVCQ